jgi:hypothetical protein
MAAISLGCGVTFILLSRIAMVKDDGEAVAFGECRHPAPDQFQARVLSDPSDLSEREVSDLRRSAELRELIQMLRGHTLEGEREEEAGEPCLLQQQAHVATPVRSPGYLADERVNIYIASVALQPVEEFRQETLSLLEPPARSSVNDYARVDGARSVTGTSRSAELWLAPLGGSLFDFLV